MAADSSATATVVEICFYDNAGYYTKGQEVKFLVSVKKQAVNVTALDGSNINVTVNGRRDSGRRSWFRGNVPVALVLLVLVRGMGHIARQCTSPRACYNCGEDGYLARQCTRGTSVVGARACYNCGEDGFDNQFLHLPFVPYLTVQHSLFSVSVL
ncbi:cold shock domain-containing protein 3-like protein [Tanacetum coccineum]